LRLSVVEQHSLECPVGGMSARSPWHPPVMDEDLRRAARATLLGLCRDGSPVVRPDNVEDTITFGWRRWCSFDRRAKRSGDFEARVEDLAKGLRDRLEANRQLVGPLMEDYRLLARALAVEFAGADGIGDWHRG